MEDGFGTSPVDEEATGIFVEIRHPSLKVPLDRCRRLLEHVVAEEGVDLGRITVILADHTTVLELNRRFLDHDFHTDVLAFDYAEEGGPSEGDIIVDLDTALERCHEFDSEFEDEALRYAIHGLLHIMGYSDKTRSDRKRMRALEDRYLDAYPRPPTPDC